MASYIRMWSRGFGVDEDDPSPTKRELTKPILLMNSLYGYDVGVGLMLHIEPPGPSSYVRARFEAEKFCKEGEQKLGKEAEFVVRQVNWIGNIKEFGNTYNVGTPRKGQLAFFNRGAVGPLVQPFVFREVSPRPREVGR